jgi:hypothetical protein
MLKNLLASVALIGALAAPANAQTNTTIHHSDGSMTSCKGTGGPVNIIECRPVLPLDQQEFYRPKAATIPQGLHPPGKDNPFCTYQGLQAAHNCVFDRDGYAKNIVCPTATGHDRLLPCKD